MAASAGRVNYNRRQNSNAGRRSYTNTYIDGNVIRHVEELPSQETRRRNRQQEQVRTNVRTRRNREKALRMNVPYVAFLAAASIATVCVCVNFLQLQAEGITYRNQIAAKESRLSEMKLSNDNAYEDAMSSINMEQIKDIAVNQLGMVYAEEGQIITYSSQDGDFIRQYGEIPTE